MVNNKKDNLPLYSKTKKIKTMFRLKEIMDSRGMSQNELSRLTGITRANINAIVNNKANPSVLTLEKIADAMGINIKELFEDDECNYIVCPRCGERIYFGTIEETDK